MLRCGFGLLLDNVYALVPFNQRLNTDCCSSIKIYNDYGPLPRSDLLRRYGYVSERYSQFDVVEFSLQSLCEEAGFQSAKPGPHQPRVSIRTIPSNYYFLC